MKPFNPIYLLRLRILLNTITTHHISILKKTEIKSIYFAKEEEGNVREIILYFNSEDSNVILGLMGKMKKETFQKVISEASKNY